MYPALEFMHDSYIANINISWISANVHYPRNWVKMSIAN